MKAPSPLFPSPPGPVWKVQERGYYQRYSQCAERGKGRGKEEKKGTLGEFVFGTIGKGKEREKKGGLLSSLSYEKKSFMAEGEICSSFLCLSLFHACKVDFLPGAPSIHVSSPLLFWTLLKRSNALPKNFQTVAALFCKLHVVRNISLESESGKKKKNKHLAQAGIVLFAGFLANGYASLAWSVRASAHVCYKRGSYVLGAARVKQGSPLAAQVRVEMGKETADSSKNRFPPSFVQKMENSRG